MAYKILVGIIVVCSVASAAFFYPHKTEAAGCALQPLWRWTDGKDYTTPPGPATVGQTVQPKTKFLNCNGLDAYFVFIKPDGGQQQVGLQKINSDNMDQTASLKFDAAGQYYYKVVAGNNFQSFSEKANAVNPAGQNACNVTLNFSASPTQVDSPDQSVNLKAVIGQTYSTCGISSLTVEFFAYGKSIGKQDVALSGQQLGKEAATQATPTSLGYKLNSNIQFTAKVAGNACAPVYSGGEFGASPPSCQNISIISTPVNVGVGVPPAAIKKYSCKNNACVEDANGTFNSLDICKAQCGAAGGGPGTTGGPGPATGPAPVTTGGKMPGIWPSGFWAKDGLVSCGGIEAGGTDKKPCTNLGDLIQTFLNVLAFGMTLALFVASPILLAWGGLMILISGGSPDKIGSGKKILTGTVIGIVIVLSSYLIIKIFVDALGIKGLGGFS